MNRSSREFYDSGVAALNVRSETLMPFSSKNWECKENKPHLTFEQDQNEANEREKTKSRETESTLFENLPRHFRIDSSNCTEKMFKTNFNQQGRNVVCKFSITNWL